MEDVFIVGTGGFETIRAAFHLSVGLTVQTPGIQVPIAAVVLGANIVEKHFALDRNLAGPDTRHHWNRMSRGAWWRRFDTLEKALGVDEAGQTWRDIYGYQYNYEKTGNRCFPNAVPGNYRYGIKKRLR